MKGLATWSQPGPFVFYSIWQRAVARRLNEKIHKILLCVTRLRVFITIIRDRGQCQGRAHERDEPGLTRFFGPIHMKQRSMKRIENKKNALFDRFLRVT